MHHAGRATRLSCDTRLVLRHAWHGSRSGGAHFAKQTLVAGLLGCMAKQSKNVA